jgi:hypothetical protein
MGSPQDRNGIMDQPMSQPLQNRSIRLSDYCPIINTLQVSTVPLKYYITKWRLLGCYAVCRDGNLQYSKIWGFHGGDYEEWYILKGSDDGV